MSKKQFEKLHKIVSKEKDLLIDIKNMPSKEKLDELRKVNNSLLNVLKDIIPEEKSQKLSYKEKIKEAHNLLIKKPKIQDKGYLKEELMLERKVLDRIKIKKKKVTKENIEKPKSYVKTANKFFANISISLYNKPIFKSLREDLVKANLFILPVSYISVILLTTFLSVIASFFIMLFFLFFNISAQIPFITMYDGSLATRFAFTFWILFVVPAIVFLVMFFYPSLEKKSVSSKIKQELPFVTVHLSAISGSMVEPSKIFEIITTTKEYPAISKEFTKIINEINIYGYNLVGALRESAQNTANEELRDLFNGLATTITSGGNLKKFFEERANTLFFNYRMERERYIKLTETFMDIYISVVIAAPMILMLLLMMLNISGLGISLSPSIISLIVIFVVSVINIGFIIFLNLKQPDV